MAENVYTAVCPATGDTPKMQASVNYDFHDESVASMIEAFGEDVCKNQLKQKLVVSLQGWIRGQLKKGQTEADVQKKLAAGEWKPGMVRPKKSQLEKASAAVEDLSPEELQAHLASIKERLSKR